MKKILVLLLALLLLAGCGDNGQAKVSDGDTLIFKVGDTKYTKETLNDDFKKANYVADIVNEIVIRFAEKRGYDLTEAKNEAQEYLEQIRNYGEYYIEMYGGEDSVYNTYLGYGAIELIEKEYIDKHLDAFLEEHKPYKAQIATFETKDEAQTFLDKIAEGSTFDMAYADLGHEDSVKEDLYSDKSYVDSAVKKYAETAEVGLSGIIDCSTVINDADGNPSVKEKYAVVNITNNDPSSFIEDFKEYLVQNNYVNSEDVYNFIFTEYEIKFYDQRTYELMSEEFPILK